MHANKKRHSRVSITPPCQPFLKLFILFLFPARPPVQNPPAQTGELIDIPEQRLRRNEKYHQQHRRLARDTVNAKQIRHENRTESHAADHDCNQGNMQTVGRFRDFAQYHKSDQTYQYGAGRGDTHRINFKYLPKDHLGTDADKGGDSRRCSHLKDVAEEGAFDQVGVRFQGKHKGRHSDGEHTDQSNLRRF